LSSLNAQVESIGIVKAVVPHDNSESGGNGFSLTVHAPDILSDCHIGDSISIDGVCLTVTEFDQNTFKVGLSPETLHRTSLGDIHPGDGVNLERAMGTNSRFGGHFVQGHVDGTALITKQDPDGNSLRLTFRLPQPDSPEGEDLLPFIIPKGYIAIDGASLTLTAVDDQERTFSVMLIAHTQTKITLPTKKLGDKVNIEVDMIGKYVQRSVQATLAK